MSFLILASCSLVVKENKFLSARSSVVKIEVTPFKFPCIESESCLETGPIIVGSGVLIQHNEKIKVLTAEHVCDFSDLVYAAMMMGMEISADIHAIDLQENRYKLEIYAIDKENDLCLLDIKYPLIPPIKLSLNPPKIGDKVYNFAAPAAIFAKEMVPIMEGFYNGSLDINDAYTLPATQGSSGSPIISSSGQLVGMIHSTHSFFPYFSLSASYEAIKKFLMEEMK